MAGSAAGFDITGTVVTVEPRFGPDDPGSIQPEAVRSVLVCGSRGWTRTWEISQELRRLPSLQVVIHGGAGGADTLAGRIAYKQELHVAEVKAQWQTWKRRAGFERNKAMLALKPDLVLAFWDGKSPGTRMMIELAEKADVPVKVVRA